MRTKDTALTAIGDRIRALRIEAELSQDNLACQVNLTRSSIANLEAGRQDIPVTRLVAILAVLGVTSGQVIDGDGASPRGQERILRLKLDAARREVEWLRGEVQRLIGEMDRTMGDDT